jgi:hypothetical protein
LGLDVLKDARLDEPLFITFWDIRRALDSIPKWIQRLAWARLGIEKKDVEWFLGLDAVGKITIRTPHQQKSMRPSNGHQVLAGGRMLLDHPTSFHPDRGIEQGDTPSTLIFIAVFDILLTLLEDSGTGEAHAYADDLAHLARTPRAQQRHAPLLHEIRRLMLMHGAGYLLQSTKAHPERIKPRMDWTADDQGIYMADLVAGALNILHGEVAITSYVADADELLASLVPDGEWVWMADNRIFTGSLRHGVQSYHYQQYLN